MKIIIILNSHQTSELVYYVADINFLCEWPEPKTSVAILRAWPKVCVHVCVQATSCVTFWSVRGATVRHTPTLHGATANTAHSASSDQHITPVLLHHTSSLNTLFGYFCMQFYPDIPYYYSFSLSIAPHFVTMQISKC